MSAARGGAARGGAARGGAARGGAPRRLLVLEHEDDAPAGILGEWAGARELDVHTARLYAGDPLPPAHDAGAVAVLGSEETPYDDTVPWLPGEVSYLAEAVSAAVPVLGICFGGQLLARVLGARLYRLPGPEIGWVHMSSAHPAVAAGPWLAYHRDAFELPRGAAELARNDVCPQAFAAGPHVGVQFHPEATAPIFRSWLTSPAHALSAAFPGTDGDPAWRRARENAHRLFSAWLDGELG